MRAACASGYLDSSSADSIVLQQLLSHNFFSFSPDPH